VKLRLPVIGIALALLAAPFSVATSAWAPPAVQKRVAATLKAEVIRRSSTRRACPTHGARASLKAVALPSERSIS